MRWLRLYAEFATDAKVQSLSESMQRRYVMLLCLKCNDEIPGLTDEEISCALRITDEETLQTKEKLMQKGLITEDWEPTNWDKRQYVSDTSNDRVKKYRDKHNTNTNIIDIENNINNTDTDTEKKPLQKRKCNVTVTLHPEKPYDYFRDFWEEYPRKDKKVPARTAFTKLKMNDELMEKVMGSLFKFKQSEQWNEEKGKFVPMAVTWLNQKRWEDEV